MQNLAILDYPVKHSDEMLLKKVPNHLSPLQHIQARTTLLPVKINTANENGRELAYSYSRILFSLNLIHYVYDITWFSLLY